MRLTRYVHSCVTLHDGDRTLLVDPGAFTPDAATLLATADGVLVTHAHPDHVDVDAVRAALDARPELVVHGPVEVEAALERPGRVVVVAGGERLAVAGFDVEVVGSEHAPIHPEIPVPHNVGYVVERAVLHPGDSLLEPPHPVDTLLVPASGPWFRTGAAIDWIRALAPRQTIPVHDAMLSEIGRGSLQRFLGESSPTGIPMLMLAPGDGVEL